MFLSVFPLADGLVRTERHSLIKDSSQSQVTKADELFHKIKNY